MENFFKTVVNQNLQIEQFIEPSIAKIYGVFFIILGMSLIFKPKIWLNLIELIKEESSNFDLKIFLIGLTTICLGLPIVILHNSWSMNGSTFITIYGYLIFTKGLLLMFAPTNFTKRILKIKVTNQMVRIKGIFLIIAGTLGVYKAFFK